MTEQITYLDDVGNVVDKSEATRARILEIVDGVVTRETFARLKKEALHLKCPFRLTLGADARL